MLSGLEEENTINKSLSIYVDKIKKMETRSKTAKGKKKIPLLDSIKKDNVWKFPPTPEPSRRKLKLSHFTTTIQNKKVKPGKFAAKIKSVRKKKSLSRNRESMLKNLGIKRNYSDFEDTSSFGRAVGEKMLREGETSSEDSSYYRDSPKKSKKSKKQFWISDKLLTPGTKRPQITTSYNTPKKRSKLSIGEGYSVNHSLLSKSNSMNIKIRKSRKK